MLLAFIKPCVTSNNLIFNFVLPFCTRNLFLILDFILVCTHILEPKQMSIYFQKFCSLELHKHLFFFCFPKKDASQKYLKSDRRARGYKL